MLDKSESVHRPSVFYLFIKRLFDIVASFIAIIIFIPIFICISISIKVESKGPVLFKHKRIGYKGKVIYLYKFRSMVNNAEDLIKTFTPEQQKEWKESYKLKDDPRITRVGSFLRKTSLDELPQLLNILNGDLSVVGPRPVIGDELEKYGLNKEKFLSVKPGLTGYWACHGRSNTTYNERMKMELFYVDNMSFCMDMKIILETVVSVLKKEGAV